MIKPRLTLGSLFSGIGGFELAASFYDIEPKWASEVDKNCINITKRRFPDMEHLGSILEIHGDHIAPVDIITGGSPCQDLSTAGAQAGIKYRCPGCETLVPIWESDGHCPKCGSELELTRSGLFMEQIRIIREMREKTNEHYPKVVVWENVCACLSSNGGDDFYCVLKEFCGLLGESLPTLRPERWTYAGEILGKKGSLAWRVLDAQYWGVPQRRRRIFLVLDFTGGRASEILLESESLRRNTPKSEVPWERFTRTVRESSTEANGISFAAGVDFKVGAACSSFTYNEEVCPTLRAQQCMGVLVDSHVVCTHDRVRRLTPLECERLQGFPDGWTEGESDAARYRMLGNSVAIPCVSYIMSGIADALTEEENENE